MNPAIICWKALTESIVKPCGGSMLPTNLTLAMTVIAACLPPQISMHRITRYRPWTARPWPTVFLFSTLDTVEYHLGGNSEEFLITASIKLLFAEVRLGVTWRRFARFHLGGLLGGQQDSLFIFKIDFPKTQHDFIILK